MLGKYILLLIFVHLTFQANTNQDRRPHYQKTPYYNQAVLSMNWTAKGTSLVNRIDYVNEIMDEYTKSNSTVTDKFNNLSFDRLPLDVYKIEEVHKNAYYESNMVYKFVYYISYDNKYENRWVTFEETYDIARFICVITDTETYCTVSYNVPVSQVLLYCVFAIFGSVMALIFIFVAFVLICVYLEPASNRDVAPLAPQKRDLPLRTEHVRSRKALRTLSI